MSEPSIFFADANERQGVFVRRTYPRAAGPGASRAAAGLQARDPSGCPVADA